MNTIPEEKTGIELIAAERKRQVDEEGWTAEHDAEHTDGALSMAAAAYAASPCDIYIKNEFMDKTVFEKVIPFSNYYIDSKKSEIRRLTIAGALIAAEIDRLQNLKK